jgi:hypothetical protein
MTDRRYRQRADAEGGEGGSNPGARWARRVVPAVLKELMRHRSVETTLKYYAKQDAEAIADVVWQWTKQNRAVPSFVPTSPESTSLERNEKAASL